MQKNNSENAELLYQAILSLSSTEECRAFFQDLCTVAELRAMAQRLEVAVLLDSGMIYRNPAVSMGLPGISEFQVWRTDEEAIRSAALALRGEDRHGGV